jgi:hypothetical protein
MQLNHRGHREYIFTMKDMKIMKRNHQSVNFCVERKNSLTAVFSPCPCGKYSSVFLHYLHALHGETVFVFSRNSVFSVVKNVFLVY